MALSQVVRYLSYKPEGASAPRIAWLCLGTLFAFVIWATRDNVIPGGLFFGTISFWCWLLFFGVVQEAKFSTAALVASLGIALLPSWALIRYDERQPPLVASGLMADRTIESAQVRSRTTHYESVVIQPAPEVPGYFVRSFPLWQLMADGKPREVLLSRTPIRNNITRVAVADGALTVDFESESGGMLELAGFMFAAAIGLFVWEHRDRLP